MDWNPTNEFGRRSGLEDSKGGNAMSSKVRAHLVMDVEGRITGETKNCCTSSAICSLYDLVELQILVST